MFEDFHSKSDLLPIRSTFCTARHMELDLTSLLPAEFAVDMSCELTPNMPRNHRYALVLIKSLSRSARILCPRLSLDATVPMEQCSAFAICSYERSSKYRNRTAIRNFGGRADTAARTELAICARA